MKRRPAALFGGVFALVFSACATIVGLGDHELATFGPDAEARDAGADGAVTDADARESAITDAAPEHLCPSNEASLERDPENCGACSHSCLGGKCIDGGCTAIELAVEQNGAYWMAIDGPSLFWTDGVSVKGCPTSGCGDGGPSLVEELSGSSIREIAATGGNVYSAVCNGPFEGVLRCQETGCGVSPTNLSPDAGCATSLATDLQASVVYFFDGFTAPLYRCGLTGCAGHPATVDSLVGSYPGAIAISGSSVYWVANTDQVGLYGCLALGCASSQTTSDQRPSGAHSVTTPAVTATDVYWTSFIWTGSAAVFSASIIPDIVPNSGQLMRTPRVGDGGSETVLDDSSATWVVADERAIYFAEIGAGAIERCDPHACAATLTALAIGQSQPFALVQDDTALYWANYADGRIMKLAK